jgi:hypothetical protein
VDTKRLHVMWFSDKSANIYIYEEWLTELDHVMKKGKWKILLLVDNDTKSSSNEGNEQRNGEIFSIESDL